MKTFNKLWDNNKFDFECIYYSCSKCKRDCEKVWKYACCKASIVVIEALCFGILIGIIIGLLIV